MSDNGKIIKGIAGFYYVHCTGKGLFECKAKGLFRNIGIKPLVGDNVEFDVTDSEEKKGNITSLLPRKNSIIRPACANIDRAVVIMSLSRPKINYTLLDKILIFFEYHEIPVVMCVNKTDESSKEEMDCVKKRYEKSGTEIIFTSAAGYGNAAEELKKVLKGKTSILTGPSGVGKSSLLNCILSEAVSETGDISRIGRGRHTTRHSEIFKVDDDTFVMDTPGYTSLELPEIDAVDLKYYYPEFTSFEGRCRFDMCTHIHEPGCAVKQAVEDGEINRWRYESYKGFFEILSDKQKR